MSIKAYNSPHLYLTIALSLMFFYDAHSQNSDSSFYFHKIHTHVDSSPKFPGGIDSLRKLMKQTFNCSKKAKKQEWQGSIFVSFIVTRSGQVDSVDVYKGYSIEANAEAIRFMYSLPKFTPGTINNTYINTRMAMPVKFSCVEKKTKP